MEENLKQWANSMSNINNYLNEENFIKIHLTLLRFFDGDYRKVSYLEALIMKFNYYCKRDMLEDDGSFFATQKDIKKTTYIPFTKQTSVLKGLTENGIVVVEKRGIPSKNYFYINSILIEAILLYNHNNEDIEIFKLYVKDKVKTINSKRAGQSIQNELAVEFNLNWLWNLKRADYIIVFKKQLIIDKKAIPLRSNIEKEENLFMIKIKKNINDESILKVFNRINNHTNASIINLNSNIDYLSGIIKKKIKERSIVYLNKQKYIPQEEKKDWIERPEIKEIVVEQILERISTSKEKLFGKEKISGEWINKVLTGNI